ncbi:hypothetical protein [Chitinimonas koreensis]|uniref:hypothetical protein n=1 Tax=Chitinimonas koreensis TaxID=356302 RepID=UPI00040790E8|nr:hypothetical protein [Chitinimonas koreensis]QNM95518.1 hypothetical protein H9L41_16830 [Chitinimonas koreensis]
MIRTRRASMLVLALISLPGPSAAWAASPEPITIADLKKARLEREVAEERAKTAEISRGTVPSGVGEAIDPVPRRGLLSLDGKPLPAGVQTATGSQAPRATPLAIEPPRITYLVGVAGESAAVSLYYDGVLYKRLTEGRYFRNFRVSRILLDRLCVDLDRAVMAKAGKGRKGSKPTKPAVEYVREPQICAENGNAEADFSPAAHYAPPQTEAMAARTAP